MAHSNTVNIKLNLISEDLQRAIDMLAKENKKTMATISANTESQEEFALSELDYDELLETYGDDPVLMTILNRMRDFFQTPNPEWFKFKEWPPGSSGTDPSIYLHRDDGTVKWDTNTTIDTTSKVSDTFTVKYDTSSSDYTISMPNDGAPKYIINE